MIHDVIVPVTCDNEECRRGLKGYPFRIHMLMGFEEYEIKSLYLWIIINGKHYCSEECVREAEDGKD